ncbi:type II secretion system protein [Bradyrhizobium sp. HKCCYLS3077]|uniref:type II secretion system protein n=1 Tax=Bradyrhizobium sp. HKCCYLS3077 TaxID=3420761 RepID=UPI003EBDAA40
MTASAGVPDRLGHAQCGMTMLEMVCVLAIVAMLAAIALPMLPSSTSPSRLEAYAIALAALLKADRNAAFQDDRQVAASIDTQARRVMSGSGPQVVQLPADVAFEAVLPQRCNGLPAFSTISFLPSGMSCGGILRIACEGYGIEIKVNWLTGDIDLAAQTGS